MKKYFVGLALFFIISNVFAQEVEQNWPKEKIYLSTDREQYFVGEDIWFSVFVSNEELTNTGVSKTAYVQLYNIDNDKVIEQKKIEINEGLGTGDFVLANDIENGNYVIRVYTRYLTSFDSDFSFQKNISVFMPSKKDVLQSIEIEEANATELSDGNSEYDVQFFVVGGDLIADQANNIAFKAIDVNGNGVDVSGKIVDENDETILTFESEHLGMGYFPMFPKSNQTYSAIVNLPNGKKRLQLPTIHDNGNKINYTEINSEKVVVFGNSIESGSRIVGISRGKVVFDKQISENRFSFTLPIVELKSGILKLILVSTDGNPLAERQKFILPEEQAISTNFIDHYFSKNDIVNTSFTDSTTSLLSKGNFIARISEENFTNIEDVNIVSSLLLQSDLKGKIEQPNYYFNPEVNRETRKQHIDLVMMTHGWAKFLPIKSEPFLMKELDGFTKQYQITKYRDYSSDEEPVANAFVSLTSYNPITTSQAVSNENGIVYFTGLSTQDSSFYSLKANYENTSQVKGKNTGRLRSKNDPLTIKEIEVIPNFTYKKKTAYEDSFNQEVEDVKVAMNENWRIRVTMGDLLIEEIRIATKKEIDERFEDRGVPYKEPSTRLLSEDFQPGSDLRDMLAGAPGVHVYGDGVYLNSVSIRGGGTPLYLLDGMPIDTLTVFSVINPFDIDYVDILKSGDLTALYGIRGSQGVVSIFTKRGSSTQQNNESSDDFKGILNSVVPGYYEAREYYNPMFTSDALKKKGYSATLFWDGDLSGDFEFQTPEFEGNYNLIIEGITEDGEPLYLEKEFEVE